MKPIIACCLAWQLMASLGLAAPLRVNIGFDGGSAAVEKIDQDSRTIRLEPTLHKDRGWRCWWYLKVLDITPGETITLDVGRAPWATPDRAAWSIDNQSWQQTKPGRREGQRIVYQQTIDATEAWFAWGPPFVPMDAKALVEDVARTCPAAKVFELCRSTEGRNVWGVRIHEAEGAATRRGIWIEARQHAWESGSSWVCVGFMRWIASDDARAIALRRQADIAIVPIMDVDNVAIGAGGKEQSPQDHNRDWTDKPHWPAVAAAQREIAQLDAAGRFDLFVDLHNPGANDRSPYFYCSPRKEMADESRQNLDRFIQSARAEIVGPLAYRGEVRESGPGYDKHWQAISKNWVSTHTRPKVVAVTLETSWNTPHSTLENYQRVGEQLGLAIERYFREPVADAK